MGRPKGLLDAGGRSFVELVARTQRSAGCERVLVVIDIRAGSSLRSDLRSASGPNDDARGSVPTPLAARLAEEAHKGGAEVVWNPDPDAGPIASLRAALNRLENGVEGVLWHPVDHPLVDRNAIRRILDASRAPYFEGEAGSVRERGVADAARALVVPRHAGRTGHPVFLGASLFGELLDPELEGGVRSVTRRHEARRIYCDVSCPGVLLGIDTPAQYRVAFGKEPRF